MRRTAMILAVAAGLARPAAAVDVGANVMPRITLGGRLLASQQAEWSLGKGRADRDAFPVSIADSSILARFDRRLFDKSVGGAVVGLEFPDPDADVDGAVFYHHVFAFLWDRNYRVELGRTKLRNFLVEFPTLRDDDLLEFTEIPNGFSDSDVEEYQQFGNHAALDLFWPERRLRLTAYAAQKLDGRGRAERLNAWGLVLQRSVPDVIKFSDRLRQIGVGWEAQKLNADGDTWKHAIMAGAVVNLTLDPADHWEGMVQAIYDRGAGPTDLSTHQGRARAESLSVVAAVNYRHATFQVLRWRAGLSAAYKDYRDTAQSLWSVVPSLRYRLGDGVELAAQYQYTRRSASLARAVGYGEEHRVEVGLTFDFETAFNDYIGERDSILNLEHGYVR